MKTQLLLLLANMSLLLIAQALGAEGPAQVYEAWPFDAAEAARRQAETAEVTKLPVTLQTALAGKDGPMLTWRLIPAGKFMQGSPASEPGHEGDERQRAETIAEPFYMLQTQLTVEQYRALLQADPAEGASEGDAKVPAGIPYRDTVDKVLPALARLAPEGWKVILPDHARLEYAARAGVATMNPGGDKPEDAAPFAWSRENSERKVHPVAQKRPNAWGLHDVIGNRWHWFWRAGEGYGDLSTSDHIVYGGRYNSESGGNGVRLANIMISRQPEGARFALIRAQSPPPKGHPETRQAAVGAIPPSAGAGPTHVALKDGRWQINGVVTNPGSAAEGLLMNVRMVNATFEDANPKTCPAGFDPDANTARFIAQIPNYAASGVNAFTLCLQGGMPGYEGAVNSAFRSDGSLRPEYLRRVTRAIEACDQAGVAVILGCYYQRQSKILQDDDALRAGVVNVCRWIEASGWQHVLLEVTNEYPHPGFASQPLIRQPVGQASLIRLAKATAPKLLVTASGLGNGRLDKEVAEACDFLTPHWNSTDAENVAARVAALRKYGKPVVVNEDGKKGAAGVAALEASVQSNAAYGLMLQKHNQQHPFHFDGPADDPVFYAALKQITTKR